MIHKALIKAEIATRYYKLRGFNLEKEPARKRFLLDKNIDKNLVFRVVDTIYREQKKLLK